MRRDLASFGSLYSHVSLVVSHVSVVVFFRVGFSVKKKTMRLVHFSHHQQCIG